MAVDLKYGRIHFEEPNTIGEDEPVVVFRAQDRLLPKLLKVYRYFCELAGSPDKHLRLIDEGAAIIKQWQISHRTQTPQSKDYRE